MFIDLHRVTLFVAKRKCIQFFSLETTARGLESIFVECFYSLALNWREDIKSDFNYCPCNYKYKVTYLMRSINFNLENKEYEILQYL